MAELEVGINASGARKGASEFSRSADDIRSRARRLDKSLGRTSKTVQRVGSVAGKAVGGLFRLRNALGVAGGATGLGYMVDQSLEAAQQLERVGRSAGVSVEHIQEMEYVARKAGIQQEVMRDAIMELSQRMGEAAGDFRRTGGEVTEMGEGFKEVGLQIGDLDKRDPGKVFREVAEAIRGADSSAKALDIAIKTFGDEAGRSMVAAMRNMDESIDGTIQEARRLGVVLGEETVSKGSDAAASIDSLTEAVKSNLTRALIDLAPHIEEFTEQIAENPDQIRDFADSVSTLAGAFGSAAHSAGQAARGMGQYMRAVGAMDSDSPRQQVDAELQRKMLQRRALEEQQSGEGGFMGDLHAQMVRMRDSSGLLDFFFGGSQGSIDDLNEEIRELARSRENLMQGERIEEAQRIASDAIERAREESRGDREPATERPAELDAPLISEDVVRLPDSFDPDEMAERHRAYVQAMRAGELREASNTITRSLLGGADDAQQMADTIVSTSERFPDAFSYEAIRESSNSLVEALQVSEIKQAQDLVQEAYAEHREATREQALEIIRSTNQIRQSLHGTGLYEKGPSLGEALQDSFEDLDLSGQIEAHLDLEDTVLSETFEALREAIDEWSKDMTVEEMAVEGWEFLHGIPRSIFDFATGDVFPRGPDDEERMPPEAKNLVEGPGGTMSSDLMGTAYGAFLNVVNPYEVGGGEDTDRQTEMWKDIWKNVKGEDAELPTREVVEGQR
ncbi:MAG: hypothetical protein ACOC1T_03715, partial [Halorhodospira sp.]